VVGVINQPITRWAHLVIRLTCGLQLVAVPKIPMCKLLKPISTGMITTPLPPKNSQCKDVTSPKKRETLDTWKIWGTGWEPNHVSPPSWFHRFSAPLKRSGKNRHETWANIGTSYDLQGLPTVWTSDQVVFHFCRTKPGAWETLGCA